MLLPRFPSLLTYSKHRIPVPRLEGLRHLKGKHEMSKTMNGGLVLYYDVWNLYEYLLKCRPYHTPFTGPNSSMVAFLPAMKYTE